MWLFAFFLLTVWLYLKSLLYWYSLYATGLFTLLYVLYWVDGALFSGTRAWAHLRALSLWRRVSPARFYLPGSEEVFGKEAPRNKKYIFVVMPNACNMPLFWGFGLHGGRFAPQIRLRYLLPRVLFYVPLLRDALMWTGAVAMRSHNPSESGEPWYTINDLLNRGYSVAYSANGMLDALHCEEQQQGADEGAGVREVLAPSDALFEYSKAEGVSLVPVLVNGETERYVFAPRPFFLRALQEFCHRNWGYPFPLLCVPTRQSQLHMQFCSVLQPHLFDKAQDMKEEFMRAVRSANNTGADKKIVFTYQSE